MTHRGAITLCLLRLLLLLPVNALPHEVFDLSCLVSDVDRAGRLPIVRLLLHLDLNEQDCFFLLRFVVLCVGGFDRTLGRSFHFKEDYIPARSMLLNDRVKGYVAGVVREIA